MLYVNFLISKYLKRWNKVAMSHSSSLIFYGLQVWPYSFPRNFLGIIKARLAFCKYFKNSHLSLQPLWPRLCPICWDPTRYIGTTPWPQSASSAIRKMAFISAITVRVVIIKIPMAALGLFLVTLVQEDLACALSYICLPYTFFLKPTLKMSFNKP